MIKYEEFLGMKQLDRIEYLLIKERQEKSFGLSTIFYIWKMLLILGFLLVLIILLFGFWQNFTLIELISPIIFIFKIGLVLTIIYDIINIFIYFRNSKKLDDRFLKKTKENAANK